MTKPQDENLYKPFAASLRALLREFQRCAKMYWPLYHERLTGGWTAEGRAANVSQHQWECFADAHSLEEDAPEGDWHQWEFTNHGLGRFFGSPDGLSEFRELSRSACMVLREMDLELEGDDSDAWIAVLHTIAFRQRLPLLRSDLTLWGCEEYSNEQFHELSQQLRVTSDGATSFPLHPLRYTLAHSVFVSSVALIEAILEPDEVLLTSSALDENHFADWLVPLNQQFDQGEAIGRQPHKSEGDIALSRHGAECWIKRTGSDAWKVRFSEDGVVEENEFKKHEGFFIYQQLLTSDGKTILNENLGNPANKPQFREGDSVVSESEMVAMLSGNEGSLGDQKFWDLQAEPDDVASEEQLKLIKAEVRRKKDLLDAAEIKGDAIQISELKKELRLYEQLVRESVNHRGKSRKVAIGNETERHRSRVAKALSECRKLIKPKMPRCHNFLRRHVRPQSGVGMSYLLANDVTWEV